MLEINSIFEGQFQIIKIIGKGGMGVVYLAEDIDDHSQWVIKEEFITNDNRKLLISEVEIMEKLTYPAFPKLRSWLQIGEYLYIIMEHIEGRTLEYVIQNRKRIEETQVLSWFMQLCDILIYLHSLEPPIVYRDLKPSNIMLESSGRIRLIDFGIAQEYRDKNARAEIVAFTRGYAAPEQYDSRYSLDVRTDIYGLAVTMHYLLTGKNPNQPPYNFQPARKLCPSVSYAIEFILKKCLQPNPDKRYDNASQLMHDLKRVEELDRELRRRERRRRLLAASAVMVILLSAMLIYVFNLNNRRQAIEGYYLNISQARTADSLEEAQEYLSEAIKVEPDNPEAYIVWADICIQYGHKDEAVKYINEEIIVRFPDIYNNADFLVLIEEIENS